MNSPVFGKTTRDITITNSRGEILEEKTEAYIGEVWYTISRNRMTYNSEGKRTSLENLAGQVTTTAWDQFACTPVGELIPAAKNAKSAKPASAFDDGNQTLIKTATGIWSVTYNGENRPILWENVSTNSPTPNSSTPTLISMSYDRMGRRVTKNNQRFIYDGYLQIANFEHQTSNFKLQTFIWDPTEPIATRPLVWNYGPSSAYYAHDGNKNVSEVVAKNGDIVAHYEYAPFGAVTTPSSAFTAANPWRFSSEYADDMIELEYFNYRHYSTQQGRWMRRDPIEDALGGNGYVMLLNCILMGTDALGLFDDGYYDICVKTEMEAVWLADGTCHWHERCVQWERRAANYKGHWQFTNNDTKCPFDYTLEDHQLSTSPYSPLGIRYHFMSKNDIVGEYDGILTGKTTDEIEKMRYVGSSDTNKNHVLSSIEACDNKAFQSWMHRLQDTYVHYEGNYRTFRFKWYFLPEFGHMWSWTKPDLGKEAQEVKWPLAENATAYYVEIWKRKCELADPCQCVWRKKNSGEK